MGDVETGLFLGFMVSNLVILALNLKIYTEIFKVRRLTGEDK